MLPEKAARAGSACLTHWMTTLTYWMTRATHCSKPSNSGSWASMSVPRASDGGLRRFFSPLRALYGGWGPLSTKSGALIS